MEQSAGKKKIGYAKSVCKEERRNDSNAYKIEHSNLDPKLADLILQPKLPEKVSRPPNAFMLFAREHRRSMAGQHPQESNKVISRMLGERWRDIGSTSKKMYFEQAKMMQELHRQQHPGYVYSPRIARMNKLEKKKNRKPKASPKDGKKENNGQNKRNSVGKEIEGAEASHHVLDLKPSTPEYVPNNPLYFSNPQPDESHRDVSVSSGEQVPAGHLALGWPSPPFSSSTASPTTSPEEYGMPPFRDPYYHQRQVRQQHRPCACGACEEHLRAFSYATTPMCPSRWGPHSMDYIHEYGAMVSNFNRSRSSYPPSGHPVYREHLFAPYPHYPTNALFENTPRFQYDRFNDCEPSFCNLTTNCMKRKNSDEDKARSYYRNLGNIHNQQPEWFAGSSCNYSNPVAQTIASQNNFIPRPEMKQGPQYFKYIDEPQYRDLNSGTLPSIHTITKSCSSLRSERMEARDDMANIRVQQCDTESNQPYCQELESADFSDKCHPMEASNFLKDNNVTKQQCSQKLETTGVSQSDQVYDYESNTIELNPGKDYSIHVQSNGLPANIVQANDVQANDVQANDVHTNIVQANIVQANDLQADNFQANNLSYISYTNESHSQNFESSDPSANVAYYVSYEPDIGSQGFICQIADHSEDELINVVDVEIPQNCNNEVAGVTLEEETDMQTEKPVE